MKKLLLIVAILLSLATNLSAQKKNFYAYKTEVYEWNGTEWIFTKENQNVNIPVKFHTRFIHIQAIQDGYYLLSRDEPEKINELSFSGNGYNAYDIANEQSVKIHIIDLRLDNGQVIPMVSIVYTQLGMNLRYFLKAYIN